MGMGLLFKIRIKKGRPLSAVFQGYQPGPWSQVSLENNRKRIKGDCVNILLDAVGAEVFKSGIQRVHLIELGGQSSTIRGKSVSFPMDILENHDTPRLDSGKNGLESHPLVVRQVATVVDDNVQRTNPGEDSVPGFHLPLITNVNLVTAFGVSPASRMNIQTEDPRPCPED